MYLKTNMHKAVPENVSTFGGEDQHTGDTVQKSYEIKHNWGDPREPEYENGHIVSHAIYKEGELHIWFKVSYKKDPNENGNKWVLTPPKDIRKTLGKNWKNRSEIFNRVVAFLENMEPSELWRQKGTKFNNIGIDLSGTKGWLKTKIEEYKTKYIWLWFTLPSRNNFIILTGGALVLLLADNLLSGWLSSRSISLVVMACGFISIGLLIRDVAKDYERSLMMLAHHWMIKKDYNLRAKAAGLTLHHFGRRYLITLSIALAIIFGSYNA